MTGAADILRRLEPAGPPDRELVARFVGQRDQAAFAEVVRRHGPVVLGVCRRVSGHPQDAEDAFQAVFLVLARKAGRIGNPDLLGNWLYGVAVRVARKARRSAARRRTREVAVSPLPDPPARPVSVSGELGPILDEELAALPQWYRDAILLCDLRGVSREEAAVLLGVPEGTLSSRLANGRKKLAARLTKRGVALSAAAVPAAVAESQAGITIPNELLTKTCGLVADWSAGAPVPGPLAKLAEGGFAVRKTLLLGVMATAVAVTGAVYAARPDDEQPAKAELPGPAVVAKGEETRQPKPDDKPGEKVAFTTKPVLRVGRDVGLARVLKVAWSRDGKVLALQGNPGSGGAVSAANNIHLVRLNGNEVVWNGGVGVQFPAGLRLIGLSSKGDVLLCDQREYKLISGLHQLQYYGVAGLGGPAKLEDGARPLLKRPTTVDLDSTDTHGYAFNDNGYPFRTVAHERDAAGAPARLVVQEFDPETGNTLKSLLTIDYDEYALAPNGKRLATIDRAGKVTAYDVDRGAKLFSHEVPERPDMLTGQGTSFRGKQPDVRQEVHRANCAFSPDGRRLVVTRGIGQTVVLNADTGEPLPPLEGADLIRPFPEPTAFTRDGRLVVLAGDRYTKNKVKGFGDGREQTVYAAVGTFLTVWDTQTGKVLKSWDQSGSAVAFNPARPLLAVLEKNGDETRLGLWDFSAEVEKK